ncbi:hypothetical protein GUITHDRAFT_131751 [Guillardia theta CCMP2712]|uniref:BZIP domain-containing protein n=1 Tax=Guillardia theta (strain CCMP2712) TaxID=905079 RepID=L1K2M5_GUITC|nr:hypothetical protein GUITHDRAFT_131751 [Guillardia theta CCMP2712]EKX54710.1 hypothetical protein GUITHDRAFT_131751 [Guillardia theta CCMP2712]|mmetsp:Transcript_17011/g.56282  ORF Transcript_17011/g.56282 Transcript_17011/m.56282 type:complete len:360 (-) Transcript_17011:241-1320(-)|eukprot:XP_005841690.1 hypothetical protein GUITHDRAFT_131751 [Guillardia theta CCMP2712]
MRRPCQPHAVLEQELSILLQTQKRVEESAAAMMRGCELDMAREIKNRVRTIKNRLAAKKSRDQARTYVQKLEGSLASMAAQNEALAQRLAIAESENESLRSENTVLKRKVPGSQDEASTVDLAKNMLKSGTDVSATHSSAQPIHLAALFGMGSSISAPPVCDIDSQDEHGTGKGDLSLVSKEIKERFGLSMFDTNKNKDDIECPDADLGSEEWRKEKRRRQNREAQRRHRERQLCQQSRDMQPKFQFDGGLQTAQWLAMNTLKPEMELAEWTQAGGVGGVSLRPHDTVDDRIIGHDFGILAPDHQHTAASHPIFDINTFPASLSRSSSTGNLALSRQSSSGNLSKEVEEMWHAVGSFDD